MKKHQYRFWLLSVFIICLLYKSFSQTIRISEDIKLIKVSNNSYIHISYFESPQYGRFPCNGLLFTHNGKGLLFDTPMSDTMTIELVKYIQDSLQVEIIGFVPNHWHADCMEGLDYLHSLHIPSYAYKLTVKIAEEKGLPIPQTGFSDSLIIKLDDKMVICKYYGAAHTMDNIVAWVPSDSILFAGCMVRSIHSDGLGYIADGDLEQWPVTLGKIKAAYPMAKIVIPGHGAYGGMELINHTLDLLKE